MDKTKEMTQEREAAILEGAINTWGNTLQITVAIEELSELQKALCKYQRWATTTKDGEGRAEVVAAIKEEIAGVSIMLNQLELIFGDCTEEEIAKLERLEKVVGIVPQQTQTAEETPDRPELGAPPSPWTPEDVLMVGAIKHLYPRARYLVRETDGTLYGCERVTVSTAGWYGKFSDGCLALACGDAVLIDDILLEGCDER